MLVDSLNINSLRVFQEVYRLQSMSLAAKELGLTQSGVSQHIKNIESFLDGNLFDRFKKKLYPTGIGKDLYDSCVVSFEQLETTLSSLTQNSKELNLTLEIGLPIEFGNNIVIPKLFNFFNKYPKLKFHLVYGHASEMKKLLLDGSLHFAFVDDFDMGKDINTETVFHEELLLCAHRDYLKDKRTKVYTQKMYEELEYISYTEEGSVVRKWFKANHDFKKLSLKYRGRLMDVQGIATMISYKMGVGILPKHMVKKLEQRGFDIYIFKNRQNKYLNPIRIAWQNDRLVSSELKLILETLIDSL